KFEHFKYLIISQLFSGNSSVPLFKSYNIIKNFRKKYKYDIHKSCEINKILFKIYDLNNKSITFIVFFLVFKHILSSLISLEFIALAIFSIFRLSPILLKSEMYSSFLFISIVVCEAALGLRLIILWVLKHDQDCFLFYSGSIYQILYLFTYYFICFYYNSYGFIDPNLHINPRLRKST
ncbi:NADH-ubiquinone oxidoreductase chain 4L, partial [Armadillidium vulgare]